MKPFKSYVFACVLGPAAMLPVLAPSSALAGRNEALSYLEYAGAYQARANYYSILGDRYHEYLDDQQAFGYLNQAYLQAPSGSQGQESARQAMGYQSYAYQYAYYGYAYNTNAYAATAAAYKFYAEYFAAEANQYLADGS